MTDYHRNHDFDVYRERQAHYERQQAYQREALERHRIEQSLREDQDVPELLPPPEPPLAYVVMELQEPTSVATPNGEALLVPPTLLVIGPNGERFGVTPQDLETGWTEV